MKTVDAVGGRHSDVPFWKKAAMGCSVAWVVTLAGLGLLEAGLGMLGIGYSHRFFQKTELPDGTAGWSENRWFAFPYFTPGTLRRPQPFQLCQQKPSSELRVFILGSSAAMGDPDASFGAARMLQRMFEMNHPEVDVRVVNAAMTAINSHTVRRIARDCAQLEPDAMIVYEGNNEVIGPFGPTGVLSPSSLHPWLIDVAVFLRERRLSQWVSGVARKSVGEVESEWGGMAMFLGHTIQENDPALNGVSAAFRRNLERMVQDGINAGAEVLLNTVIVNRRDFSPFQSEPCGLPEASPQFDAYQARLVEGDTALKEGDPSRALHAYQQAWELDSRVASLAYRMGRASLAVADMGQARYYLDRALELDTLRFRTSDRLNTDIREVAKEFGEISSFSLVDAQAIFSRSSQFQIIGSEWLYEHVHLNIQGNYQLARLWYVTLSQRWVERGLLSATKDTVPSLERISRSLAFTAYEQAMIADELLRRFSRPPFTAQIDASHRIEAWSDTVERLSAYVTDADNRHRITQAYVEALHAFPNDAILKRNHGMALCFFKDYAGAIPLLEEAAQVHRHDPDLLFALAWAYHHEGDRPNRFRIQGILREVEPRHPGLEQLASLE